MPEPASPPRRASLAAIFAVVFIDLLGFGIVLPLLPRYGEYFAARGLVLGALVASFSAMQFLFAPLWGRLSDRVGRRPVLLIGLCGSSSSYLLFGWATSLKADSVWLGLSPLAWLFVSRIGAGIAGATISTAQAYIADVTPEDKRAKGMALIGAAFGCGFTFGPLLGAMFVSGDPTAAPSPYPGYLAAALSFAALIAAAAVLKEPQRHASRTGSRPSLSRLAMLNNPARVALFGQIFITTGAFAIFESTLSLLSQSLGYSDRANFYLFAYIGLTLTIAQGLLVRRLATKLREKWMAPLGLALLALGLAALSVVEMIYAADPIAFFITLSVCVIGFAFVTPALQSLLSLSAADNEQGAVLGLGQSANALARIAGPAIGLPLFMAYAAPLTYGLAALLMVMALVAIFPVLRLLDRYRGERIAANDPDNVAAPFEVALSEEEEPAH